MKAPASGGSRQGIGGHTNPGLVEIALHHGQPSADDGVVRAGYRFGLAAGIALPDDARTFMQRLSLCIAAIGERNFGQGRLGGGQHIRVGEVLAQILMVQPLQRLGKIGPAAYNERKAQHRSHVGAKLAVVFAPLVGQRLLHLGAQRHGFNAGATCQQLVGQAQLDPHRPAVVRPMNAAGHLKRRARVLLGFPQPPLFEQGFGELDMAVHLQTRPTFGGYQRHCQRVPVVLLGQLKVASDLAHAASDAARVGHLHAMADAAHQCCGLFSVAQCGLERLIAEVSGLILQKNSPQFAVRLTRSRQGCIRGLQQRGHLGAPFGFF